ncbi:MAG: hypothetical protein JWP97_4188 [Labilithrix sp.]|nr:hypothetical protein [Labilithrix sp.]
MKWLGGAIRQLLVPRPEDVPAITGLRALSVVWVIVQHVQQGLRPLAFTPAGAAFLASPLLRLGWAGNLGVDVFFVISGYLIGGMLMRERETTGALGYRRFYLRRAMRILPAYLVVIALNVALSSPNRERLWTNLLFVNDFVPFQRQFMAHTWSLAIEEQFYALFPLFVAALYLVRPRLRTPIVAACFALLVGVAVALVVGGDLELSLVRPSGEAFWRYMDLFYVKPYARFGAFFVGALVVRLERSPRVPQWLEANPIPTTLLVAAALAALAFVVLVFPECRSPSGALLRTGQILVATDGYVFSAGIGALVLVSRTSAPAGKLIARVLGLRALHPVAQLSYAAFLVHPLVITRIYAPLGFDLASPVASYLTLVAAALSITALASLVLFFAIEQPFMRLRPPRTARSLVTSGAVGYNHE